MAYSTYSTYSTKLLLMQSDHRIHRDARRAGMYPAAPATIDHHDHRDHHREDVGGCDAEEQVRDEPAGGERDAEAKRRRRCDKQHRLAHHQPQHVLALRAERHADADLVGAPRDVVRHQAEQTDRREQQREPAEQRIRLREQLFLREALLDLLDLRRDIR